MDTSACVDPELLRREEESRRRTTEDEEPRPLLRDLPPAEPFPVDALGDILSPAALAIHDLTQSPLAICAQSVLAAATLAAQAHADVMLPTGQTRPISCYFLTIGCSGERKSACDDEALGPIRHHEDNLRERYETASQAWHNENDAWEEERKRALRTKTFGERRRRLDELGPAPRAPVQPIMTAPEPTFEGICKLFAVSQPSLGVFSAEGGLFIGGHAMSADNKLRTGAGLSDLWDGAPIKRVRAGDGTSVLPGRRLSMHLMAQPDVARTLLSDRALLDQGLLSRILTCFPESAIGTRLWREPATDTPRELNRYHARLMDLLEAPPTLATLATLAGADPQIVKPPAWQMSPKARALWIKFVDHVEVQMRDGGQYETIRGLANKLPEHAARLATVLEVLLVKTQKNNNSSSSGVIAGGHTVSVEALAHGMTLVQHYAGEAVRLCAAGVVDPKLSAAARLLDWLQKWLPVRGRDVVSLAEMYQFGPPEIRSAQVAKDAVHILESHGWLAHVPGGAEIDGDRRRDVWRLRGQI